MIRVVLADDQLLVRQGIRGLLEMTGDVEVVGEAGDGLEAVDVVMKTKPDVRLRLHDDVGSSTCACR